jgi:hypothetical protein
MFRHRTNFRCYFSLGHRYCNSNVSSNKIYRNSFRQLFIIYNFLQLLFIDELRYLIQHGDQAADRTTSVQFPAQAVMGNFLFATMPRPTLEHTQPSIQWVGTMGSFLGGKAVGS